MKSMLSGREHWDNLAADPGEFGKTGGVSSNTTSFENCAQACEANRKCFQYSHHGQTCNIGMSVRLGYEKESDGEEIWRSGWNKKRLDRWVSRQPKCDHVTFPEQGS